jgi:antitoxin component YwqK of YwqJK toxin-antitoxin module
MGSSPATGARSLQKTYFEDGTRRTEVTYRLGKRSGPSRTWWDNGKPASVEEWLEGKPTRAKRWNGDGKLISDDEFEPDGSRKLKR